MDIDKFVNNVVAKFIGTKHERDIKRISPLMLQISSLAPDYERLTDAQLAAKTPELKAIVAKGLEGADPADPDYRAIMQKALEPALIPAFATVREAGRRTIGLRHFDVQLIGGIVLHEGKISEMKTGEGKTLVATLPAYLNALAGRGVHIVTVNDYLARRDAEWMSPIFKLLGMTIGVIVHDLDDKQRREAYGADITYGTNNELGFDYLRDNMKYDLADCVQRGHHFCIVDEVDSILIDEARTPLIISGPAEESTDKYFKIDKIVPKLVQEIDFTIDEKQRTATLTEEGVSKTERLLGLGNLYDPAHMETIHHVYQALRAHTLYKRDTDYVVNNGEIIIVDEFTGRQMPGRRWADGLHQAVEAKEGVKIERENQTLATITFQNYFRMYKKLAGMTGTAETEAAEFAKIYNLDVVSIPTNRPLIRTEHHDIVYRTEAEKYEAVVNGIMQDNNTFADGIRQIHETGQPILVGTISIEKSEHLAGLLKKAGIPHEILNAKQHEREAKIIAQAGRKGSVTVSTNMAGRGTDILLGGNPEALTRDHFLKNKLAIPFAPASAVIGAPPVESGPVNQINAITPGQADAGGNGHGTATAAQAVETAQSMVLFQIEGKIFQVPSDQWKPVYDDFAKQCRAEHDEVVALGGLHILGTERHEARRIDNQLRGRAGRQGDPGSSRFFLSLEDELLRVFGGERVRALMYRLGMTEGVPIESKIISRQIENAQKAREGHNFEMRKHLLEYDDVMNRQRETIYSIRRSMLEGRDQKDYVLGLADDISVNLVETYCPREQHPEQWNTTQFTGEGLRQFGLDPKGAGLDLAELSHDDLVEGLQKALHARYEEKEKLFGPEMMRWLERRIVLDVVDNQWKDHLLSLDHLKEGINLRGYGQKDPLVEFKKEAFTLFEDMMDRINSETIRYLFLVQPKQPEDEAREIERRQRRQQQTMQLQAGAATAAEPPKPVRTGAKVGRNDPCPCGSGKKYKKCHGSAS
ncbi:MAG TPA: preprotein translocase subunit SecA [Candidatus Limnocylindrales bacterium]|nr:preprotein translocase subunit SecA [Candidatus Limnocylindrales bacterium]